MLIATGEPPREVTLLPDKNGSTLKSLQALVGGNIETFGITPGGYDISVESHDCTSGRNALAADAPARDAPGKDDQNIE